jgi:adenylate kinase
LVQAEALDESLSALGSPLERCLAIHVESEELVQRLLKRSELEGRVDDNEETIRERMRVYQAETEPLLSYYRSRDLLREIAGAGSIEEISQRIEEALARP